MVYEPIYHNMPRWLSVISYPTWTRGIVVKYIDNRGASERSRALVTRMIFLRMSLTRLYLFCKSPWNMDKACPLKAQTFPTRMERKSVWHHRLAVDLGVLINITKWRDSANRRGSGDGVVVRALDAHQYGPASIHGPDALSALVCIASPLWFEGFSPGSSWLEAVVQGYTWTA